MTYNPLVSIIVPIYKSEKYLNKCLNSIVRQTYKNLEIILIDDGSPDNCPKMCDNWSEKDSRIKVIHKENEGQGVARNVGMTFTTGEYLLFVDSDDYIDVSMVEKMVSASNNGKYDLVLCGMFVDTPLRKIEFQWFENNETFDNDKLILEYISSPFRISPGPVCKMFRRNNVLTVKFPAFRSVEDAYAMPHFLGQCKNAIAIPEYLYYYVQHPESTENRGFNEDRLNVIDCKVSLMDFIKENYPHYYSKVADYKLKGIFGLIIRIHTEGKKNKYKDILQSLENQLIDEFNNIKDDYFYLEFVKKMDKYLSNPNPWLRQWKKECLIKKIKSLIKYILITFKKGELGGRE